MRIDMDNANQGAFIKEYRDNTNLSYIIQDEQLFFETGYKVLQSQVKNGFVKCTRVYHNGKIKLVYQISKYKSLESILQQLTAESFLTIISKLLNVVVDVRNNGFMQSQNIDISFNKVFVDTNNLNVYLVYLPLNLEGELNSNMVFEEKLKNNIIDAISLNPNLNSELATRLSNVITSGNQPLEAIIDHLKLKANPREVVMYQNPNLMYNTSYVVPPQEGFNRLEFEGQEFQGTESNLIKSNNLEEQQEKLNGGTLKKIFLALCQLLTLVSLLIILLAFDFDTSVNIVIIILIIALDLIISSFIIVSQGKGGVKANGLLTNNNIRFTDHWKFQLKDEGGATEVLEGNFTPTIAIIGENTPMNVEFIINKAEYIIGKKEEVVDGLIWFNKAISRVHCKITCVDNKYYITDMGSANGTYVNGLKVAVDRQIPITVGDKIRLGNSEFIVKAI